MNMHTSPTGKKKVSLALQGGGSLGAFTWGVLDALLEQPDLEVEGISGTSAGSMNAVAIAQGLIRNGNAGARESLKIFWESLGELALSGPLQFNPLDKMVKKFDINANPFFHIMNFIGQILSPYQLNPLNIHPMRHFVENLFDFKELSATDICKIFLCATHVFSGKLKIFKTKDICVDSLLASACIPRLFQAIQVKGEFYWDGGFIGNPAIYPLIYDCETPDIIVIQTSRVHSSTVPTTIREIHNRLGEITQNSCLVREFRSIAFITDLIDKGVIPAGTLKRLHMHLIRDDGFFSNLDYATGFSADPDFLAYLFEKGRRCGERWIQKNYDQIGHKGTAEIEEDFIADED